MAKTVLSIRNMRKLYRNGRGVRDISLELKEGEIMGLLGPNGSGKTTTMKAICGMCGIDAGEIRVFGRNIDTDFEAAMEGVGALIEAPAIYENLSARKNMRLAARFYPELRGKAGERRIDEVLELVKLREYGGDKAGRFSLGMKQRLGLALAFLSRPKLVILDEPTNGLDIEGVVHLRGVIRDMAEREGAAFLIAGHIAAELEKVCGKAAVIHDGQIPARADMQDILENHPSLEDYFLSVTGAGGAREGGYYERNDR